MKYLIGIDLGTTNSTITCASQDGTFETLCVPQFTAPGTQASLPVLPSFLYVPMEEERLDNEAYFLGAYARDRGAEVPGRVVMSAKSWLCCEGLDRREKILPLNAENCEKFSPVDACTAFLAHLRHTWNEQKTDAPFDEQQILITVPASFDPSARQLVQEAAELAGFPEIILLEEPQAAFYAWLQQHAESWREQLNLGDRILVVDIGGGTTDFTLIEVGEQNGELSLGREAVGEHLLLGGDNLDLALAYLAKEKLDEQGHELDNWQMQSLVHGCRQAKEAFLGENPPENLDIAIRRRSSRLIGGSLSVTLTKQEVDAVIVEGFFPLTTPQERSKKERRLGIQQVGLPYAQDPRVSCQLAKFLSMSGESEGLDMAQFMMPTAVLFNGGTLKAAALRERLVELLNSWAKLLSKPAVKVLTDADYDFAVSRGAAYYGMARNGKGIRIRAGTSRSYFIGVEEALPAVPGLSTPLKAVCVVPFGMEEGSDKVLDSQEFALTLGQTATFRFFSRAIATLSDGTEPVIGTTVRNWKNELTELHPIETLLDQGALEGRSVRVTLRSKVTPLGILELWCQAADGRQWKLEFDLRRVQA